MQRLTAILFLFILLFNFYGYRVVLSCLQTGNETAVERRVDGNNYRNDDLVSIKTKLDVPYYTASPEYERAYGSIEIDGKEYDYVKRRVYHDTLELLCLPNGAKTALKNIGNDLAKAPADEQSSLPSKKTGVVKIGLPDFFQPLTVAATSYSTHHLTIYFSGYPDLHGIGPLLKQDRPPKLTLSLS